MDSVGDIMLISKETVSKNTVGYGLLSRDKLSNHSIYGPSYGSGGIDQYTKLMLHMNGANGSTVFTDSSLSPKTVTANGNAQISTAQYKFGSASGLFDGSGDYLSVPHSTDFEFGIGDFSADTWVRFAATGLSVIIGKYVDANNFFYPLYYNSTESRLYLRCFTSGSARADYYCTFNPSLNTWYHIEVCRSGSSCLMFVNGILQTVTTLTAFNGNVNFTNGLNVGCADPTSFAMNGSIDETRLSKGIARHTTDFTPPIMEYST